MMNKRTMAVCLLCAMSAGCATPHRRLVEHPKRTVRYPAKAGETIGYVAGGPVALVCLPITLPIYAFNQDSEKARWAPLYPWIATRDAATALVGGGPWLVFGWWGIPETEFSEKMNASSRLPRGTYVETPEGSMVVGDPSTKTGEFSEKDKR